MKLYKVTGRRTRRSRTVLVEAYNEKNKVFSVADAEKRFFDIYPDGCIEKVETVVKER